MFEVYALNAKLGLPATATRAEVLAALQGKVVGKGVYVGRFRAPECKIGVAHGRPLVNCPSEALGTFLPIPGEGGPKVAG